MRVVKSSYLSVLHRVFEHADECFLSASCLLFCQLDSDPRLLPEADLWQQIPPLLGSDAVLDIGMPKRRAEFLVWGDAFSPAGKPVTEIHVRAQVGPIAKSLYVVGDRYWNGSTPTEPEPFTRMSVSWRNAFGGQDFALNPIGKGMRARAADAPPGKQFPLPNIEMPGHVIRLPGDRPEPAGFAPFDITWPQRASFAGTYDADWFKSAYPGFARDLQWDLFNAAPRDQQLADFWRGDEPVTIENMHPSEPTIHGVLPGVRPRLFIEQAVGDGRSFREVEMRLDTVWLFPELRRIVLVFHGMARIEDDQAHDIEHLLAACEQLGCSESLEYYERALRERIEPQSYERYALDPFDLAPKELLAAADKDKTRSEEEPVPADESLFGQRVRKRAQEEREKVRTRISELGLDPKVFLPPDPPPPPMPRLDQLGEAVAVLEAEAESWTREAEAVLAGREQQIRQICRDAGVSPDAFLTPSSKGPPRFSGAEEIERFKVLLAECRQQGIAVDSLDQMVSDPQLEKRLRDSEAKMLEVYRQSAHLQDPAPRLQGQEAAAVRARVETALARGESLAGWDLTGANLRGVNFAKADMHGVLLENANLAKAELSGCDLGEAVLANADLERAKLAGARLCQANLGRARLASACLDGADLSQAVCYQAVLSGASLRSANLAEADLMEAVVDEVDLSDARATRMTFCETSIIGMKANGADLSESSFLGVTLRDVDFTNATMRRVSFVNCRADSLKADGADLRQSVMTSDSAFPKLQAKGANLTDATLSGTDLTGADFSAANLDGADLDECKLVDATLSNVTAKESRWGRADLSRANLGASNLMNASLARTVLKGANFRGCNLYGADLARAELDEDTDFAGAEMARVRIQPLRSRKKA